MQDSGDGAGRGRRRLDGANADRRGTNLTLQRAQAFHTLPVPGQLMVAAPTSPLLSAGTSPTHCLGKSCCNSAELAGNMTSDVSVHSPLPWGQLRGWDEFGQREQGISGRCE